MPDQPQAAPPAAPIIRRLTIDRFRGIEALIWQPAPGVNVILGGGDVGKTTVLEAIALLLSPTNAGMISDTDYYRRDVGAGFAIEAVVSLPGDSGINDQVRAAWPWQWNGSDAVVPVADSEGEAGEPVYKLRVRGTSDLELAFEVLQPDGSADPLSVALRRSIGLVRLAGDDRGDRDLRLVQGSALDKLVSDNALRSRIATALAGTDIEEQLLPAGKRALEDLDDAFTDEGLPDILGLSIIGGPGPSIASLIGLTADKDDVSLPLTMWGAGTRRLSALAITAFNQRSAPITIVDEVERGLEPYRQRRLIGKLQDGSAQAFLTTHSPSTIAAAAKSRFWYVDATGKIGRLDEAKIARHRANDPAAFLSRFAVIAEGKTEVGFVCRLLEKALGGALDQHGIHVSDGGGNESTLDLLEALAEGGVAFGGFADNEGLHPVRWQTLIAAQGGKVFRWAGGCLEDNIVGAFADSSLEALVADAEGKKTGQRLRTLQERLGTGDKAFATLRAAAPGRLREKIIEAAKGTVPDGTADEDRNHLKSHAQTWFKSLEGGRELADKMFAFGLWPAFKDRLLPFCNAVLTAVGIDAVADIQP
jgi:putative ATP-dependent endonuclease of the OLD family